MGNPVGVPPTNVPTTYPDYYDNLTAINLDPADPSGNNVILTDESAVTVSGIGDAVGATIVTYLLSYNESNDVPDTGGTVVSVSSPVVVTDLGSTDANNNEIGTFSASLPTAGVAPGIYIAESIIEFQGTDGTVYEDGGAGSKQIVSVEPTDTQTTAVQLSGTGAEISTDGRYLVYTAINEYNEPETTGDVYERDLQTGAEVDLTATGKTATGVFATNHPANGGSYPGFTSANGAYSFSTINDFDLNPQGGGYNPLPVVTNNATGDKSVIGGIGGYKYFVGAATAASDSGSVVLSVEPYPVLYHASGSEISENPDPQIYVTYLNAAPVLTINALNGNYQYASNATSVTVTGNSSAIGQTVEIDLGAAGDKAGTATVSSFGAWSFTFNPSAVSTTSLFIEASVMSAAGTPAQASETATAVAPPVGPDTFSDTEAASSGTFIGRFTWSDSANWSAGLPVDGDSATLSGSGIDDLASLSLTTLAAAGEVAVVAGSLLSVSTLSVDSASGIEADTDFGTNALVNVLIGTIIGSGALIEAEGTGASTQILEAAEPAEFYQAADGGRIILDTLAAGATFGFELGTLALVLPGATTTAHIENIAAGDVLELPGSAVTGVTYGTDQLTIATSSGTYDFSDVTYGGTLNGYSVAMDTSTGLEAITFTYTAPASDTFKHGETFSGGFLNGSYLWNDNSNWVGGQQPQDGDSVIDALQGGIIDDNLSLASLSMVDGGGADLIAGELTVGTVMNNGVLIALDGVVDSGGNGNVTIALDNISLSGAGGIYMADGPGAYLIDNSAINPGGAFVAEGGGFVELTSAPGLATLDYSEPLFAFFNGPGTIALTHPGATIAASLNHVTPDDVLELPGKSVSAVHFGTASLTITTSAGTYDFTNVSYDRPVTGYTAAIDPSTGLEAITFTGTPELDVFTSNVVQNTQEQIGEFWTDSDNWSNGVPLNGDSVQITAYSGPGPDVAAQFDNIADLSLSSMSVLSGAQLLIATELTVGTLTLDADANVYDQGLLTVDGTTVNDGQIGTDPSSLIFDGAVTGTGTITIGSGSDVTFKSSVSADETIVFANSTGTLTLTDSTAFDAKIIGNGIITGQTPVLTAPATAILSAGIATAITGVSLAENASTATEAFVLKLSDSEGLLAATGTGVSGAGTKTLTLSGTLAQINADLATLTDTGAGTDKIILGVTDSFGNTASAGIATTSTIAVTPADVFSRVTRDSSGAALWNYLNNWSESVPYNGDSVIAYDPGVDNIAGLSLSSLQLLSNTMTNIVDELDAENGLTVGRLTIAGGSDLEALDLGVASTVTIDAITTLAGDGAPILGAGGAQAVLIDKGIGEPAIEYRASTYGMIELAGAPNAGSQLYYANIGTFALAAPGAVIAARLEDIALGDVLELPGSTVEHVVFGASSLTITTDKGTYDFSNVSYGGLAGDKIDGYSAHVDASTGLIALTFTAPDVFSRVTRDSSGAALWDYLNNWSQAVPFDGDSVIAYDPGTDNIAGLSLTSLQLLSNTTTNIIDQLQVGDGLTVTALTIAGGSQIEADDYGTPSTLTIDGITTITGDGMPMLGASGAQAVLIDTGTAEPVAEYYVGANGTVELESKPNAGSVLFYENIGTFALAAPGATIAAALDGIKNGAVLELPGSVVEHVVFGASSLTITTNTGTYDFSDVSYASFDGDSVNTYSSSVDTSTGLEAIHFIGPDVFSQTVRASNADFLWSNVGNWSDLVPVNGDEVISTGFGTDDVAGLSLASLFIPTSGNVVNDLEVDHGLTVGRLTIAGGSKIEAEDLGMPSTVTLNGITTIAGDGMAVLAAGGAQAVLIDTGKAEPVAEYDVDDNGTVEFTCTPNAGSVLFFENTGTFAFTGPGATIGAALDNVQAGDVLELTGSTVLSSSFGASSLTITTDKGSFDFTDVSFNGATGFTSSKDGATGLEALTFTATAGDVFSDNAAATTGPLAGDYLWSNTANWSEGIPVNAGVVDDLTTSLDDIANLTLSSLVLAQPIYAGQAGLLNLDGNLTVGALTLGAPAYVELQGTGGPHTLNIGTITVEPGASGDHSEVFANGTGNFINDEAASEPALWYVAQLGGRVEIDGKINAGSSLSWNLQTGGTIALADPGNAIDASLLFMVVGDVLELPGTKVLSASLDLAFPSGSMTITTDDGVFAFSSVESQDFVTGYSSSFDAATGLVAVTLTSPDVFSTTEGHQHWSEAANWSKGLPVNGEAVSNLVAGFDDIPNLTLSSLYLALPFENGQQGVLIDQSTLTVGTLVLAPGATVLVENIGGSDILNIGTVGIVAGKPATETVLNAAAAGSIINDKAASEPALRYIADTGGRIEIDGAINSGSVLSFEAGGTFALADPGSSIDAALLFPGDGDVLELPGSSLDGFSFGASGLIITTNLGSYDFTNVIDASQAADLFGYTASHDSATGLEAITFTSLITTQDGTVTVAPPSGQTESLNQLLTSANITPPIASLVIDGPGTVTVTGDVTIDDFTVSKGVLVIDGVTVTTDPVTIDTAGDIFGYGKITGSVDNAGSITANGGTLELTGSIGDAGTLIIDAGADLVADAGVTAGQIVDFAANTGVLTIGDVKDFDAKITGFQSGDQIDLANIDITSATILTLSAGGVLAGTIGGETLHLTFSSAPDGDEFVLSPGGDLALVSAPTIIAPALAVVGQFASIAGVSIVQPGATTGETYTVIISDAKGVLSAIGKGISGGGNALTISGALAQVNSDLATLTDSGSAGTDKITLGVVNSLGATATSAIAVTATGGEIFSGKVAATSGPLTGEYLWSNAANWSQGLPANGEAVTIATDGFDNIASLSLSELDNIGGVDVVASALSIGTLVVSGTALEIGGTGASAVKVTVGTIVNENTTTGYTYIQASGTGSTFIGQSLADPGRIKYVADSGGKIILAGSPNPESQLLYSKSGADVSSTIVLENPGTLILAPLVDVAAGDVLELPGSSVSTVTYGANSLTITTDQGKFDFSSFNEDGPLYGYTASHDSATGLEAITFSGATLVINAPASENVVAGLSETINGVFLTATHTAPGETYTVKLTDTDGLLSATGTGVSGTSTKALTITGSFAQVDADIETLTDTDNIPGTDKIIVTATDSLGGNAAPVTIAVTATSLMSTNPVIVHSGQTVGNLTIGKGASEFLQSGAVADNVTITTGGVQGVLAGGSANTTIVDGGVLGVAGVADEVQVNSGGYEVVGLGGKTTGTTIHQGGYGYVLLGGIATNTTIAAGGTMLIGAGGKASGVITFAGPDAVLSVAGSAMPGGELTGFDQNGAADDAIILTGFTYAAGHDTASLGKAGVLTLNLNGTIEKLNFNPAQSNAGHSFAVTTNSLDQVVIIDPATGTKPSMDFLAPATAAGAKNVMLQVLGRSAGMVLDLFDHASTGAAFQPALKSFAAIDTLDMSAAGSSLSALNLPGGVLSVISRLAAHPG